jgi:hypothetical protein
MTSKVLVFVPTIHYGGLDMLFSSLERQTYPYTLCMADELANQRIDVYAEHGFDDNTIFVDCFKQEGNVRALAQAYNNAAEVAVDFNFDLMVSLQDYIWIPDNGIEMFVEDHRNFENCLITGLVSLSDAPSDQAIGNPYGMYSIFNEPLVSKPSGISWEDPRGSTLYKDAPDISACTAEHWEANWAAIPVNILKEGMRWDLSYDHGVAYENMDFAKRCELELGTAVILDKRNHAVGIPHREIWPEEEELLERYTNRWSYEGKWGKPNG